MPNLVKKSLIEQTQANWESVFIRKTVVLIVSRSLKPSIRNATQRPRQTADKPRSCDLWWERPGEESSVRARDGVECADKD
ncbi:hypothetical protein, partial [Yersinia ruckeri]|uniref:hypothetical protein n=1 Tax=Yersinia ruckeri TaxID=29486 RepID=UPI0022382E21